MEKFQNKKGNDLEEKVVIYTHRTYIPEEPVKDSFPYTVTSTAVPIQNIHTPGQTSTISSSSQPSFDPYIRKKETSKGLWFMKGGGGGGQKITENKKMIRQQKREAKNRLKNEMKAEKLKSKKDKKFLSQSNQFNQTVRISTADYDGFETLEPIEPIEIPVDDEYTESDDEIELRNNLPNDKPKENEGQDDSIEVGDDTEDTE